MAPFEPIVVDSWDELRARIGEIVDTIDADPALARAAALNPRFALEEIGIQIARGARAEIEERLRFRPKQFIRRRQLREDITRLAGGPFPIDSPKALESVLYERLDLRPDRDEDGCPRPRPRIDAPPAWSPHGSPERDPIEDLRGTHEIVDALLEYRSIDTSRAPMATRDDYDAVRRGERALPVLEVRVRLKRRADGDADDDE